MRSIDFKCHFDLEGVISNEKSSCYDIILEKSFIPSMNDKMRNLWTSKLTIVFT